jgi:hypothetical protein
MVLDTMVKRKNLTKKLNKINRIERKIEKAVAGPTRAGLAMRELGAKAGGLIGLSNVGHMLGAGLSRITGQGAYRVRRNRRGFGASGGPPAFGPIDHVTRIQHREFIQNLTGSTAFSGQGYNINPGLSGTFPWLSQIAQNYEKYRFNGLCFYFNPTSGTAVGSTNTALGVVGGVTQYDPDEAELTTKQQAENYTGCVSGAPFKPKIFPVECKRRDNPIKQYFVREGALPSGDELKFHDVGKFQWFTAGMQASNVVGELWVTYDVSFYIPRMPSGGNVVKTAIWSGSTLTGVAAAAPLGTALALADQFSNMNISVDGASDRIVFDGSNPDGPYLIIVHWIYAADTISVPGVTCTGSLTNIGPSLSLSYQAPQNSLAGSEQAISVTFVNKSGSDDGYATYSAMTGLDASGECEIIVTQMDGEILSAASMEYFKKNLMQKKLDDVQKLLFKDRNFERLRVLLGDDDRRSKDDFCRL